jgi:hypothetical protein
MSRDKKPPSQRERKAHALPGAAPVIYQIRVRGIIGQSWSDWFGGMQIEPQADGQTRLTGVVTDQAALHGILDRLRDLNLPLVSVTPVTGKAS